MAVYISLTLITTLLALLVVPFSVAKESTENLGGSISRLDMKNRVLLMFIFLLLFGVSACRIAVGNDYWVYREYILLIAQNRHVATEFGFNYLVRLMQFLTGNDECYLLVLGIFSFFTVYCFVKAVYEQCEWFAGGMFLLLTGGYYFLSLNSVRYYFALALAMVAMKRIQEKEYLRFLLLVLIGACFHKSILVILILYPLAKLKLNRYVIGAMSLLTLSLIFCKDFYRFLIFKFYPYYEDSMFDNGEISYMNIAKGVAVIAFALINYKAAIKDSDANRFYLNLQIGSLILYSCASYIPELSRIGYYLNVSLVFLIPNILSRVSNRKLKILYTSAIALCFIGYFAFFLKDAYSIDVRILPYRNWIFN